MLKIGLTYDLRQEYLAEGYGDEETGEFDRPDTIEAIENTLQSLGYQTDRIGHIRQLVVRLAKGDRWDLVFNIAEGLKGFAREAQIPALLEAYNIPYTFSDALAQALTLHKGFTKHVLQNLGLPTPAFAVVETEQDIRNINLPYPLFAKPVAEGTAKGISPKSKLHNPQELEAMCKELLAKYQQPVLVETFLPGREVTVSILGTGQDAKALDVVEVVLKEHAEQHAYSYVNKENCEELILYRVINDAVTEKEKALALAAYIGLGCRDAGRVDLRQDAYGEPSILELNSLPGMHPLHSDLPINCNLIGISYKELIATIMNSALKRVKRSEC